MEYRDYQQKMHDGFAEAWASGAQNVLGVLPTGGGKSALIAGNVNAEAGPTCSIAHRQELVSQISLALARFGITHRLIAADSTIRNIVRVHMETFGRSFYDPRSRHGVASVDTLVLLPESDRWLPTVKKWVVDECHHLTREGGTKGSVNKWMKAISRMPLAKGLGLTATPLRADGKGLGRFSDGVMDVMIQGPEMRELIQRGYLTDYEVYCPPSDIDLSAVGHSGSGDFSPEALRKAVHGSRTIVGDVVSSYLRLAPGKRGVTFCVDIGAAQEVCSEFRRRGVPAEVLTGKTPDLLRAQILRGLRDGRILQVVSVDVLSEGFDLPAIEVVSFARPTDSLGLYRQQFGRVLRTMPGKAIATVIDHVGNVVRHRPPDALRAWSLDRRERKSKGTPDDLIPMRSCPQCTRPYERTFPACPYCGHAVVPAERSAPQHVDGDLVLLTPDVLAKLRGEIDAPLRIPYGATPAIEGALRKHHSSRNEAQAALRAAMDQWAGYRVAAGEADPRVQQRRFFLQFGVDVLSAQALPAREANELRAKIEANFHA